jgi:hypothetical protein
MPKANQPAVTLAPSCTYTGLSRSVVSAYRLQDQPSTALNAAAFSATWLISTFSAIGVRSAISNTVPGSNVLKIDTLPLAA